MSFNISIHNSKPKIEISRLGGSFPDSFIVRFYPLHRSCDEVTHFIDNMQDLINFKNNIIQEFESLLRRDKNA